MRRLAFAAFRMPSGVAPMKPVRDERLALRARVLKQALRLS